MASREPSSGRREPPTELERANARRYYGEFGAAMIGYVLIVSAVGIATRRLELPLAPAIALALVPMVPVLGATWAVVRSYRRMDELQQRTFLQIIGFAFACTAVAVMAYGFLDSFAGFPTINSFWVWAVMGLFWMLGGQVIPRRLR